MVRFTKYRMYGKLFLNVFIKELKTDDFTDFISYKFVTNVDILFRYK